MLASIKQWLSQFSVLIWKNLKLRSKAKFALVAEMLAPICFFLLWVSFMAAGLTSHGNMSRREVSPLTNHVNNGHQLLYAPLNTNVEAVMSELASTSLNANLSSSPFIMGFATLDLLREYYNNHSEDVFAGILFGYDNSSALSGSVTSYAISMDNFNLAASNDLTGDGFQAVSDYLSEHFMSLQLAVDMALLKVIGGIQTINATAGVIEFPDDSDPLWKQWDRSAGFGQSGAVFFLIGLFASCFRMMTTRVTEKEKRIRELLLMGGLRPGVESAAWWVTVSLFALGPIIGAVYILKGLQVFYWSNISYVCVLFVFALFSLIALAQLVAVFINKAKFAGLLGLIITVTFGAIGIAISVSDVSPSLQLFLCIFPPTGFAIGNGIIFKLEDQRIGLNSHHYNNNTDDLAGVRNVVGLLIFDCIIYTLLAWYLNLVMPGEYGTAREPFFCFRLKFWRSLLGLSTGATAPLSSLVDTQASPDVEAVGAGMSGKEAVVLKNVRKEFHSNHSRKVAVDGLSVSLYEDHITAFLGHNGAGKTTTISMLTGLIPPTSGEAYINGLSIGSEMDKIRASLVLGVCPQANVLWDEFSVEEHLYVHAGLKGVNVLDIRPTVDEMIKDLGLEEKRHTRSAALSGGQKRKLQLAISFIGQSNVIFLDEPTSGMDPVTRRSVWDFLNKYKAGKAIVLTTHFMDEADLLGDRIVVISHGKVRCAGSSLFLKSRFGVGYLLTMVKTANCHPQAIDTLIKSYLHFNTRRSFVSLDLSSHIGDAALLSEFGAELAYRLPSKDLHKFSELFAELDKSQDVLGIDSYGISLTTLEEVFLRIGLEEKEKAEADQAAMDVLHSVTPSPKNTSALNNKPSGGHSFAQQTRALIMKRALSAPRDTRTLLFSVVIPLICVAGAIALCRSVEMHPSWFSQHVVPLPLNISSYASQDPRVAVQGGELVGSSFFAFAPFAVAVSGNTSMHDFLLPKHAQDYTVAVSYNPINNVFSNQSLQLDYLIWFNKTYLHTVPITANLVHNAAMRLATNNSFGITTTIAPFEHILTEGERQIFQSNPNNVIYFSLLMCIGFAMILGGLSMPIAQERALNIKRLMLVSGASKLAYWVSALIWDLVLFFVLILFVLILLAAAQVDGYNRSKWGIAFLFYILHSFAGLTLTYVFTLRIKSHSTAMAQVFAFHFLPCFIFLVAYCNIVINYAFDPSDGMKQASSIMVKVFCALCPNFNFAYVLLTLLDFVSATPRNGKSWFSFDVLGFSALAFIAHAIFWWCLLLFLEYRDSMSIKKLYKSNIYHEVTPEDEDQDVTNERQRVATSNDDVIIVRGMRKEYPDKKQTKVAVANLSLGIPMGQCFGLLGMNGAGKSTTLGVLSADIAPTAGEVFLNGYNLQTDPRDALRYFGWCPQFDALVDTLTGREQLTLYARIKGMDEAIIPETVDAFLEVLDMEYLADRLAGRYSGGNKRKLSMAIAMIGNPPLVFLDEPSTGMDPLSKRLMWQVITQLGQDKAIVVTTHYMEECEALCSRIGIMSQGRLVCLGSSQHLKSRFATGYTLQIKAKPGQTEEVQRSVAHLFPTAQLTDAHDDLLAYQLPHSHNDAGASGSSGARIAPIFAALVSMAELTDDYAVSQTTLEQVFLKLAKEKDTPVS